MLGLQSAAMLGGSVGKLRAYNTNGLWLLPIDRLAKEAEELSFTQLLQTPDGKTCALAEALSRSDDPYRLTASLFVFETSESALTQWNTIRKFLVLAGMVRG